VGRANAIEAFRLADPAHLTTLPLAGTPTHLSVDGGRLFVTHRPASGAHVRLTAFAPGG
jgi:hypothetical protein